MKVCALLLSLLVTLVGCPVWADGEIVTGPDRRDEIDLRIEQLDAERDAISTRGPKVATLVGLGTIALGAIPLAVGLTSDYRYTYSGDDYARWRGGSISGVTLMAVGGLTAFVSGLVWGERVGRRNEIDAERERLIEGRARLMSSLSRLELRSPYRDRTQFVTLGVRF